MAFTYKGFLKETDPIFKRGSRIISGANLNMDSKKNKKNTKIDTQTFKEEPAVPAPPQRKSFKSEEEYLEMRDSYNHRIGRHLPRSKKRN